MDKTLEKELPIINSFEQQDNVVSLQLTINKELRCFKGHFDEFSVVPGVVQLDWAIAFSRKYLTMQGDVVDVSVLKFQNLLLPEMQVQLHIIKKSEKKFTFSYTMGDNCYSSARVEFF